jgi:enediyne biosynthesis protein E3
MNIGFAQFRRSLLGLSPEAVKFDRRGFRGATTQMRERIENIGTAFLGGYHFALESASCGELENKLPGVELELRGFAFEGAAMSLALMDFLTPWRRDRVATFLQGAGSAHAYMVHVGIGWVWARLPFGFRRRQRKLDPLLGWLAFDGWGFHEGFFNFCKYRSGQRSKKLRGYELRAFDQGFGRSLWFVNGGNADLISKTISGFSAARQADLWSGIGLAATCAGMVNETELCQLRDAAGDCLPQVAQGSAFAAKARQRAGNLNNYTDRATKILCGLSANEAALITDDSLENIRSDTKQPAYEIWRRRIQNHFAKTLRRHQI